MTAKARVNYDIKRFSEIKRDYKSSEVERLRGSIKIKYSMCKLLITTLVENAHHEKI